MRRFWILVVGAAVMIAACSSSAQTRVVVGAGTTLIDSQFMAEIVAAYAEVEPSTDLAVVGLGSSQAIAHAAAGDADVIITHNRAALEAFLVDHPEANRFDVFASSFFVVADPSIDLIADSLDEAFSTIAHEEIQFVSRDDNSGTHAAELSTWDRIGVEPAGEDWYTRTGTGMGATMQVADQRHAATLTEHGAFLASVDTLSLVRVRNTETANPYDLTVVDPDGNPAAAAFAEWIVSPAGRVTIEQANEKLFGEQVYAVP